jgi:hypothetical protein
MESRVYGKFNICDPVRSTSREAAIQYLSAGLARASGLTVTERVK